MAHESILHIDEILASKLQQAKIEVAYCFRVYYTQLNILLQ